jgi:drug/metabolite transporter (DMT)-like permease
VSILLLFVLKNSVAQYFFSLTGAVSATFGIPFAMLLFDEPILPALVPSATLIVLGIICMMKGKYKK